MPFNTIIVRYGEISLKGRNRGLFEDKLKENIIRFLQAHAHPFAAVDVLRGRLYIRGISVLPELRKVLGVHSYSPAWEIAKDYEVLKDTAPAFIPQIRGQANFRIVCQRTDKRFQPDSMTVEREIGERLRRETGTPVRLQEAAFELHIEIGMRHIYLFTAKIKGPGGLPFQTAGKLVVLFSGGIDSPVAAFLMMKRGVEPVLLHFEITAAQTERVRKLKAKLEEFCAGFELQLEVHPRADLFAGRFTELSRSHFGPYVCVLCKYLMHKKANEIVRREGAWGVITGDNLAQVASQTLKNLYAQRAAGEFPVYSPLIGFDKEETIHLAREIGTYDLSIAVAEGCTPPRNPKTGVDFARLRQVLKATGLE